MDSFTPATDIWIPGFDQFDRPCWQNKRTQKLHYDLTGQLPRSFGDSTNMNLSYDPYLRPGIGTFPGQGMYENTDVRSSSSASSSRDTPRISPSLGSMPPSPPGLGDIPSLPPGQGNKSSDKVSPLEKQSETKSPAPPTSRAEEAKQWSRKRDVRGYYYLNSVTGETQSKTPDCLKKYTRSF